MTIAPIGLSYINHVDAEGVILTAGSAVSGLDAANLTNPRIGRRMRQVGGGGARVTDIDFGGDKTIGVVALRFPRDTPLFDGNIRHRFDADGGTPGDGAVHTSALLSSTVSEGYGYHTYILSPAVSARYWRFTYTSYSVAYIDTGRAWAGELWQPTDNIVFGYEDAWDDRSQLSAAARSGAEYVDSGPRQRVFAFALEALSDSERDEIRELQRIAGISGQLLFVKDPDNPSRETVLGRLAQSTPIRHRDLPVHAKAFVIRESL